MGEIVFALKKQSMTAFIAGRKNNSLILFSQKHQTLLFPLISVRMYYRAILKCVYKLLGLS